MSMQPRDRVSHSLETLACGKVHSRGRPEPSHMHIALPPEATSQCDGGPRKGPPYGRLHHLPQGLSIWPLDGAAQVLVVLEACGTVGCSDPPTTSLPSSPPPLLPFIQQTFI